MKTHYHIFSTEEHHYPRSINNARKIVRRMVTKGQQVICDKVTQTKNKYENRRIFRNDDEYPLNELKATINQ